MIFRQVLWAATRLISVCATVTALLAPVSHAQTTAQDPIEAGAAALARGHSATAYRAWIDLARACYAQAQIYIGYLLEYWLGLSQSYQSSLEWYR